MTPRISRTRGRPSIPPRAQAAFDAWQQGETMASLARRYRVTPASVANWIRAIVDKLADDRNTRA